MKVTLGFWLAICISLGCSLRQPLHQAAKKLRTTGLDADARACSSSAELLQLCTLW